MRPKVGLGRLAPKSVHGVRVAPEEDPVELLDECGFLELALDERLADPRGDLPVERGEEPDAALFGATPGEQEVDLLDGRLVADRGPGERGVRAPAIGLTSLARAASLAPSLERRRRRFMSRTLLLRMALDPGASSRDAHLRERGRRGTKMRGALGSLGLQRGAEREVGAGDVVAHVERLGGLRLRCHSRIAERCRPSLRRQSPRYRRNAGSPIGNTRR